MISQKKYYKISKTHAFESLTVSSTRQQWRVKKIIMTLTIELQTTK